MTGKLNLVGIGKRIDLLQMGVQVFYVDDLTID
jgi:hypothetical protein